MQVLPLWHFWGFVLKQNMKMIMSKRWYLLMKKLLHSSNLVSIEKMSHFFGVSFENLQYLLRTEALSKLSGILRLLKVNSSREGVDLTAVTSQQISQIWAFTSGVWSWPTNYKKILICHADLIPVCMCRVARLQVEMRKVLAKPSKEIFFSY